MKYNETERINIKKIILGVLTVAMLLSLFGCGCTDTSGTPDAGSGMSGDSAVTLPGNDMVPDSGIDDGMNSSAGDVAGDEVIDGDNYDTAHTDANAGNPSNGSMDNSANDNGAVR